MSAQSDTPDAKSPEQLREEIEETRQALGDTVEELSAKTDVKARVSARAGAVRDKAREAVPDSAQDGFEQVGAAVRRRPVPLSALAIFAAGALVGWRLARR